MKPIRNLDFEREYEALKPFGGSFILAGYWENLRKRSFAEAEERIIEIWHWETVLSPMRSKFNITVKEANSFLELFNTHEAYLERLKAIKGLTATRYFREKGVLRTARALRKALDKGIVPQDDLNNYRGSLTWYLLNCISENDWQSLQTLSRLLKDGDEPDPETARGGRLSYTGEIWTTFCQLHFQHLPHLPTKREIREEMNLPEYKKGNFSSKLNDLGLGGLPTG